LPEEDPGAAACVAPSHVVFTAQALHDSLEELVIPTTAAVVLAIDSPRDLALLAAALPGLRATALIDTGVGQVNATRLIERLRPALLVTDRPNGVVAGTARAAGVRVARPEELPGHLRLEPPTGQASPITAYAEGTALVLQTTGTTGEPKLVGLSRANLAASIAGICETLDLRPDDRTATVMPLTHIHGLVAVLHASLAAGATVVPIAPGDLEGFWRDIAVIRPTWLSLVPTLLQRLLDTAPSHRPAGLSGLRFVRTASAALPLALRQRVEAYFDVPLIEAYGMTEACHQIASGRIGQIVPGSVGRPSLGVRIAVLDPTGDRRPDGGTGEICIQGPNVIRDLLWPETANAEAFHGPWFRTGDSGRIDTDGQVWLSGRQREFINRGGETLPPRDIEDVLLAHPAVAEAAVFPVPHASLGDEVAALCVIRPGYSVPASVLIAFAAERLPFAQVPKTVFFADALPLQAASGKVSRLAIAEAYRDQVASPTCDATVGEVVWRDRLRAAFAQILCLPTVDEHVAFFALGGDSLDAIRMVSHIEAEYGLSLPLEALLVTPSVSELARGIAANTVGTKALPREICVPTAIEAIPASAVSAAIYLLGGTQTHRLFARTSMLMRLRDDLDYAFVAAAFDALVAAQPALHTRIEISERNKVVVLRPMPRAAWTTLGRVSLPSASVSPETAATSLPALASCIADTAPRDGDPVSAVWIDTTDGGKFLLIVLHDALADGSARALLPALIEAALTGRRPPEPRPFAALMAATAGDRNPSGSDRPTTPLHPDGEGAKWQRCETVTIDLPSTTWARIETLARAESLTPFSILCTAFALLLDRVAGGPVPVWTGQQSRRDAADFATLGCAHTMICLTPDIAAERSFTRAARAALRQAFDAMANPTEALPGHDTQTCSFDLEDEHLRLAEIQPALRLGDAVLWSRDLPAAMSAWDLRLSVRPPGGDGPGTVRITVDLASFSASRASGLLTSYMVLLNAVLEAPGSSPADLPIALAYDRAACWDVPPPDARSALTCDITTLASLFSAIVRRWPDGAAFAWEGGTRSFTEVAALASEVETALMIHGVKTGDIVAFRLTTEADAINRVLFMASEIAALRLGCPFMPLGRQVPPAQARAQLAGVGARAVIFATAELDCAPDWQTRCDGIADFAQAVLLVDTATARPRVLTDTALLLTSSGSTGAPKTIRLSHAVLLGFFRGLAATCTMPAEPSLMGQNIGFDAVITDVWMPWIFGRHVVVLAIERRTPDALAAARALGAKVLTLSPTVAMAALGADADCFMGFDVLQLVGEVLSPVFLRRLAAASPGVRLVNGYGPAENAVLSTAWEAASTHDPRVPIGRALPGYRVLVADERLRVLPPHWPGELLIASAAPAQGYVDTAMTAARFTELPGEQPGPFFRSGDHGWIDEAGRVQFIGRRDRQVKIAGVRIEIDAVENCISEVLGVANAGVVMQTQGGRSLLLAVVQPKPGLTDHQALSEDILAYCRKWLPRAALPAEIAFVDAMPVGGSGKKSHSALQEMLERRSAPRIAAGRTVPEQGSIEAVIAELWRTWLEANGMRVGHLHIEDDVFALGATSIDALSMAVQIEQEFAIRLPEEQMFVCTTIAAQAALVRGLTASPKPNAGDGIDLRLVRAASGISRGALLGLPLIGGGAHYIGMIAAHMPPEYDLWTCTIDLAGREMHQDNGWVECAQRITARLLATGGLRLSAMIGFSIGGRLGWLIDRLLVAAGQMSVPVINLDGGSEIGAVAQWREQVAPLLPRADWAPSRMLLLHRGSPGRFVSEHKLDVDWANDDVRVLSRACSTVAHLDFIRPALFDAHGSAIAEFVETDDVVDTDGSDVAIDTPGGALFRLLADRTPPTPRRVLIFLAELGAEPVDHEVRLGLLYIALACGDPAVGHTVTRRLIAEEPTLRDAFYSEVALLAEHGHLDHAAPLAAAWCAGRAPDFAMIKRAGRRDDPPSAWDAAGFLFTGNSDTALDIAAAFGASAGSNLKGQHPLSAR
jgi:acyl-CoA synthetase (AMP-forming)/AMP-acid ligase II/acyl carrier protein